MHEEEDTPQLSLRVKIGGAWWQRVSRLFMLQADRLRRGGVTRISPDLPARTYAPLPATALLTHQDPPGRTGTHRDNIQILLIFEGARAAALFFFLAAFSPSAGGNTETLR